MDDQGKKEENGKNWNNLPVEIKEKVADEMDFLTLNRLSISSLSDRSLLGSIDIHLNTVIVDVSSNQFRVSISDDRLEHPISITAEFNDTETRIARTFGSESTEKCFPSTDKMSIFSVFNIIFRRNVQIGTLCLLTDIQEDDSQLLTECFQKIDEIPTPKRLIFTGKSDIFKNYQIFKSKKSEILTRNFSVDTSRKWSEWRGIGFKYYTMNRWKANGHYNEHIKATVGIELVLLVALIQDNTPKNVYWIPGNQIANPENKLAYLEGDLEPCSNYSLLKLPINDKKSLFVKFKECGISIKCCAPNFKETEKCDLDWMCPECRKSSAEIDYYHQIGNDLFVD